jgi:alpha-glucosidase
MEQNPEPWSWWKHGVIYHIYPRSFQDSNGDGIGDIGGIIGRLGYLKDLGVDGIWLSPIFKSPMVDFGYDVSDYREIDPVFGTMDDFKALLAQAHALGIRVILDMILNHTSDQHPWFIESSSSPENPKRNWYIWKDPVAGKPPNNWKSAIGGSAWKLHKQTGQYYLHSFFKEQPDLNWRDSELPELFFAEMKFWLDLGVDGFRFDVINMIAKDKKYRSNPAFWGMNTFQKHVYTRNRKRSVSVVKQIRELLDRYDERVSVGEVYTYPPGDAKGAARYLAKGNNGLHLTFDFSLIFSRWNAAAYYKKIKAWYVNIPEGGWPSNVLSNHDLFRSINRVPWRRNREKKAKVAAALLLTLWGTPFIYYGEETGMHNTRIGRFQLRDPLGKRFWPWFHGRDRARTPMQWSSEPNGGFTTGTPWLPMNKDYRKRNARRQDGELNSLLSHYRNLIGLRKSSEALQKGSWEPILNGKNGVLAYCRHLNGERLLVILNFTGKNKSLTLSHPNYGKILFSTHHEKEEFNYFQRMRINPFEATIYNVIE